MPPPPPRLFFAGVCLGRKTGTKTRDQTGGKHLSRPRELVFALALSFQSVAVGFAILCSHRWILANLNAWTVAFIEIGRNCPLFTLCVNEQDFELHLLISSSRDRYM